MTLLNHRYKILKSLGRGATATVYLASDVLNEETPVALKIFHRQDLQAADERSLGEQFLAVRQIEHPNIARVFDYGRILASDSGEHLQDLFFTLEYVEGPSLLEATENASWEQIGELFYQLGHALSYLHAHGLIHGDLNPQNILVTEAVAEREHLLLVKIVDLGFVFTADQSRSEDIRGTLPYLAPELIGGQPFDYRIDLYALGVTLYQVLTRRLPYDAEDVVHLLKDHLLTLPPPVSSIRPDTPPPLVHLVERLLQKDPAVRGSDALEIAHGLATMTSHERILLDLVGNFHVRKLVGREAEYNTLRNLLTPLRGAHERGVQRLSLPLAAVVGEAGMGKTALLDHIRRWAQVEEIAFVYIRPSALRSSTIYFMQQTLKQLYVILLLAASEGSALIDRFRFLFRAITPELSLDLPEQRARTGSREEYAQFNTLDAYTRLLQAAATLCPFAFCIEDIETLNEEVQALLRTTVRALADRPVLLLFSCKAEVTVESIIEGAAKHAQLIPLRGLSEEGVQDLARLMLRGAHIPLETARRLREETGGAPPILKQFLSQLDAETGAARLAALDAALSQGTRSSVLAKSVQERYSSIFAQLQPDERYILNVASCFRDDIPRSILHHVYPYSSERLDQLLARLTKREVLSSSEGGTTYRFCQRRFHEYVFETTGGTNQPLHLLIAQELEKVKGDPEELAYHFRLAGETERAYSCFLRAAERARVASAFSEQIRLLNEALSLTPNQKPDVLEQLAEGYAHTGRHPEASTIYRSLLERANLPSGRMRHYLIALSASQADQGQPDEAEQLLLQAAPLAESLDDRRQIEEDLASVDLVRGNYREARAHCLRVLEMSGAQQENPALASVFNTLGVISFHENKYDDAIQYFGKTLQFVESSRRKDKLITAHMNLGNVFSTQKRFEEAQHHWQLALNLSQEVGSLEQEAQLYNNLGIAHFVQERYPDALQCYERSLALFTHAGNLPGKANCQTNMAEVFFAEAAYEKALVAWERAQHLYEEVQDAFGLTETCNQLAHVYVIIGKLANARACVDRAAYYIEQKGIESQRGAHYLVGGILATQLGEFEPARRLLRKAVDFFLMAADEKRRCDALLRLGVLEKAAGRDAAAVELFREVVARGKGGEFDDLIASALFSLGAIAEEGTHDVGEQPLTMYKRAFTPLKDRPVNEITWKLCFKLGKLYLQRGLTDRGKEYLMLAASTLDHLVTGFTKEDLRDSYLETEGRGATAQEIRSLLGLGTP